MFKKNIAKLLVFAMILSMLPFSAVAAENEPVAQTGDDTGYITKVDVALVGTSTTQAATPTKSDKIYTLGSDIKLTTTSETAGLTFTVESAANTSVTVYKTAKDTETVSETKVTSTPYTFNDLAVGPNYFVFHAYQGEYSTATAHVYKMTVNIAKETAKTYTVTVGSSANGTVTADKRESLKENDLVTLTVSPDEGYELDKLEVKDADGKAVTLTADNKFNMPASNVTVTATFKKTQTDTPVETPKPTVTLDKSEEIVVVGDSIKLIATTTNAKETKWSSSNDYCATVDTGLVKGVAAGEATITVTAIGDGGEASATCKVTVKDATLDDVTDVEKVVPPAVAPTVDNSVKEVVGNEYEKTLEGVSVDGLTTAIKASAENVDSEGGLKIKGGTTTVSANQIKKAREDADSLPGNGTVQVVVVPKLKIALTTAEQASSAIVSMTFNIEAIAEVRATKVTDVNTALNEENSKLAGTVELDNMFEPITITIPLPSSFAANLKDKNPFVRHRKGGNTFWHSATLNDNNLSFTNTKGFSPFDIMSRSGNVAAIGETLYSTLEEAIKDVSNGGTITVLVDNLSATVSREVTFTLEYADGVTGKATITEGSGFKRKSGETGDTYTYQSTSGSRPSGGGGGGGGGSSKPAIKPGEKPTTPGTTTPSGGVAGFNDVAASAWYADAVQYVVDKGLFGGVGNGNFAPNANMTRAMMWTVLARYKGVNTNTGSNWYEAARTWAIAQNISDGTMADGNVTREQFVTMLWRLSGEPAATNSATFTDAGKVSDYAKTAVAWAVSKGIVNGYNDGSFKPQGSATRAEVAKMLTVFCQDDEQSTATPTDSNGANLDEG